ncbi:glycosyltransferase [Enterobacter sichuanensis]|uniref:glycosyltransferase n=1 Tax=Enterobacter sichuanensis TaxID=2071710 RepID=UPI001AAF0918|nr:glycosyltransferase [Enterobacter sichuanensis]MBO2915116.1 glycosyltransferase [Enterobacter sichuanensis]MBO2935216.1 glycosyltransferase [Enterobacter sichuanensis]
MKKIAILLAAYNGREWLEEQLTSILKQLDVEVEIFISIDFSQDETLSLCECFATKERRIHILPYGERFGGAAANFFRLIKDVDFSRFDYVAFSDQDDIWVENKLIRASSFLKDNEIYSSNVTAFWPNGRRFLINKSQPQVKYDFLFEAAGPGCTYVIRRDVAILFKRFLIDNWEQAKNVNLHDWLFYAYARVNNYSWVIDSFSGLHYRQHENNQVGANNTFGAALKRFNLIRSKWYKGEILKILNLFEEQLRLPFKKELVSDGYFNKIKLLWYINEFRRKPRDRLYLALAIIVGAF